jgi:DNA-binding IscR family transcriptional regulator
VLGALGGKVYDEAFCDRHSGIIAECVHHNDCAIRGLWSRVQSAIDGALVGITLQDLVDSKINSNMVPLSSIPVMERRKEELVVE